MASGKTSRLGTGLSALFGEDENVLTEKEQTTLPISRVEPRKDQPRKEFDPEAIGELADSIRTYGLIQPITVRELDGGLYQIIAGERRWRAAREAGLTEVPVRIVEADDKLAMEMALVENLQREDLNPIEEAMGYQRLMDEYGLTQEDVSTRVQKSRSAVANSLRLLGLSKSVLKLVSDGSISAGHARALLTVKDKAQQEKAAKDIMAKGMSVREAEQFCSAYGKEKTQPARQSSDVDYVREAEKALSTSLGRSVRLSGSNKKGKIILEFYSADDREALMDALMRMDKPWKIRK